MEKIVISGTGLFSPPESISNEELVCAFNRFVDDFNHTHALQIQTGKIAPLQESSADFILKASGIKNRRVMNKSGLLDPSRMRPALDERSNDQQSIQCEMAVSAAHDALHRANRSVSEVDAVIVACSNMQRPYPAIAIEVQAALGIQGFGFDMNAACSSATFGIQTAADMVASGRTRSVLVINPEICTAHLNYRDRDSHFIFGDACTAVLVESASFSKSHCQFEILGTKLTTSFSNNIRNNFGFLNPTHPERPVDATGRTDRLFVQEGRKVFKEVVPMVATLISDHLTQLGLKPQELKRYWLHQANLSMNQLIMSRLLGRGPVDLEAPVTLDEFANTSSAGSIIAFHRYNEDLEPGDMGAICSFGAGYSAGNVVVKRT